MVMVVVITGAAVALALLGGLVVIWMGVNG
jgi:hypothetical protein